MFFAYLVLSLIICITVMYGAQGPVWAMILVRVVGIVHIVMTAALMLGYLVPMVEKTGMRLF